MKKTLLLVLGVALPIMAIGAIVFRRKKLNPKDKLVAFMGDSYTAGYGWGWQSQLAKTYEFNEKNLAVGGVRTAYMLQQTIKYLDTNKPYLYFIYGGANDAYSLVTNKEAFNNVQAMVDTCNKRGVQAIVISGYNAEKVQVGNPNAKTTIYVKTQQEMWNLGKKYFELQKMLSGIKDAIVVPIWSDCGYNDAPDGLHLTAAAQKRFAAYVGNYLFNK